MTSMKYSIAFIFLNILALIGAALDASPKPYQVQPSDEIPDLNDNFLLVHTLNGELILVDRKTGDVKWAKDLGPVLIASYDGGPVLIADPLDGRLYEYSDETSADILRHLDHSIMGYVRRSPAYYKHFLSFGSKVDFWMSIDLNTGKLLQSASQDFVLQCPGHLNSSTQNGTESGEAEETTVPEDLIGIGRTQYNLLFRDPITGVAKLNLTYTTFATHTDPDVPNHDLRHIATTRPGLLTFEGQKLIWHLPLTSPVVGLYSAWAPPVPTPPSAQSTECLKVKPPPDNPGGDSSVVVEVVEPVNQNSTTQCNKTTISSSASPRRLPRILRRVAFTTYALDMPDEPPSSDPDGLLDGRLESKFSGSLDLAPSLLVGSSVHAPLYAIPCVAEVSLKLRGIRRASELFMIEGPSVVVLPVRRPSSDGTVAASDDDDRDGLPASLTGLYELPPRPPKPWTNWDYHSPGPSSSGSRFPQLTGPEFDHPDNPLTIRPGLPESDSSLVDKLQQQHKASILSLAITVGITFVCLVSGLLFVQRNSKHPIFRFARKLMLNNSNPAVDLSFLPSHFDTPDSTGWAGCTAQEAGQPEAIRINLNEVLGHGANGTMVFAGMFGSHRTAVKRIVRQPQLEKHWRREHAILLRHHHPHLIRCYWTGSTANFHYLVMQRCATTLSELLRHSGGAQSGLDAWGLTACEVIHQVVLAVACLHQNRIVHRDLKPSNVLIATNESGGQARVVVGDFGLSRPMPSGRTDLTNSFGPHVITSFHGSRGQRKQSTTTASSAAPMPGSSVAYACSANASGPMTDPVSDLTSVGVTFGTMGWMAPELCDSTTSHLTYAIDIFACGLLAYHVLTGGAHPFDRSDSSDSEQPSLKADSGSSLSGQPTALTSNSGNGSNQNTDRPGSGSTSCETPEAPFCYSTATRFNRHHARQLAIAENRTAALHRLTESDCLVDVAKGFLARQLIQTMLSHDPQNRPSADEVTYYPLFWSASKIMRFLSELSDFLDTREGDSQPNGLRRKSSNFAPRVPLSGSEVGRYLAERRALLESMETYAPLVFNEHWFYRLEPEVVQDLLTTRGYQDTSLMDLLRAIRNKHNHLWHLQPRVRMLLGSTQEGMATYWTSRFPSLVPLLYGLSRRHLTGFNGLAEFLPPASTQLAASSDRPAVRPEFEASDWWRTTYPIPVKPFPTPNNPGLDESIEDACTRPVSYGSHTSSPFSARRSDLVKPWKRGQVVPALTDVNSSSSPRAAHQPNPSQPEPIVTLDVPRSDPVPESPSATDDPRSTSETDGFIVKRARRRPSQPKKIRPAKKNSNTTRERLELIARSGCELVLVTDDVHRSEGCPP